MKGLPTKISASTRRMPTSWSSGLRKREGLLVGISSGANAAAALEVAARIEKGVIVTILCDAADKYLSEHFWEEE